MGQSRQISSAYRDYLAARDRSRLGLSKQDLSWRGFCVGGLLSLFLATTVPYGDMVIRGTEMAADFDTPGAIFLFFLLTGGLNLLFKLSGRSMAAALSLAALMTAAWSYTYFPLEAVDPYSPGPLGSTSLVLMGIANVVAVSRGRSLALNRAELILVYAMLLIVSAVCSMGMGAQVLGMISALFYYASPENGWEQKLFPHLPDRHILVDDGAGNSLFYEGAVGLDVPYGAWAEPLMWWAIFLFALFVTMVSIAVILRRHWMDGERLAYPVVQVGRAMVRGEESSRLVNRFFRQRAMWIGWSIPMFYTTVNGMHAYNASFPNLVTNWNFHLLGSQNLRLSLDFIALGFSYFIHTHLAIGICIFHILAKFEKAWLQFAGITSPQKLIFGVYGFPLLGYQGVGALIAMVIVGMWIGRSHLRRVLLKALGRAPEVDDGDEIMSYRAAFFGAVGGVLVMASWLWVMGTPAWISLLFVVLAMLVFIGITRIVVEAGLVTLRAPMCAPDLVIQGIGSALIGPTGVLNLSLAYMWGADLRVFVMGTCANALKLIEEMDRVSRRRVFWGIILAMLVGALGSLWMIFNLTYTYGGINMGAWYFLHGPATAYDNAVRNLVPQGVYWPGLGAFAGGGTVMALMMFARNRFAWWPVHPIGFPIGANAMTDAIWFSVFLAWVAKVCVLRLGGAASYRRSQPFFLGLLAGKVTGMGMWLVIDYFTGVTGHYV